MPNFVFSFQEFLTENEVFEGTNRVDKRLSDNSLFDKSYLENNSPSRLLVIKVKLEFFIIFTTSFA